MLIGQYGLAGADAHLLVTDMALLTGCAMMIYGYALSARRHRLGGLPVGNRCRHRFSRQRIYRTAVFF